MKCLNCKNEMVKYIIKAKDQKVGYNICEHCGSLWFEKGELKKTAYQVDGDIELCSEEKAEEAKGPERNCPSCGDVKLDKVFFLGNEHIILDHCKVCDGFWLDSNELDIINKELKDIMPVKGTGFSEFLNNAHIPLFYKRIKISGDFAESYHKDHPPIKGAEKLEETDNICPVCNINLFKYNYHGTEIEGCQKCHGLWLEKEELRDLKDSVDAETWSSLRWLDEEIDELEKANAIYSSRNCPTCKNVKLLSTTFGSSPIVIDWCPNCHGTWLDKHEFEDIVEYLKEELNNMDPEEAREMVYKKLKEIWTGPEGPIEEILDSTAAIAALVNITVFEHPKLAKLLIQFNKLTRGLGI